MVGTLLAPLIPMIFLLSNVFPKPEFKIDLFKWKKNLMLYPKGKHSVKIP